MDFLSSTNSSTNGPVNTANKVYTASTQVNAAFSTNIDNLSDDVICAFLAGQPNSPQLVHEDLKQIHPDDMEEMDLIWQIAMLTMRARRFLKKTGRKLTVNGNETLGFDMSKVEYYNGHKRRHFSRECKTLRNQDNKHKESTRRSVSVETPTSTSLVSCDECQIVDNCKKGLGYKNYNAVPPPYTRNFMSPKPDLSYTSLDEFAINPVAENVKAKSGEEETKAVRKNNDAPIIEEYVSDDELWSTVVAKTINREAQIHARVDGKKTHKLKKPTRKVTHVPQPSDPIEHVAAEASHKELGDILVRATTTAYSLEAEQDSGNINRTQSKATPNESSSQETSSGGGPRVLDLEKTKTTQQNVIDSLKRRIKKLERRNRSRTHKLKRLYKVGLTARVESSRDEHKLGVKEVLVTEQEVVSTAAMTVTTEELNLAQALKDLKTLKPKVKGIVKQEQEEPVKPKKKDQIRLDEESALKLQVEFDEEQRLAREKAKNEQEANIPLIETWDDVQAKIDADYQLAKRLTELVQGQEKEKREGEELIQKRENKQKVEDDKEIAELKQLMEIFPYKEEVAIDAIPSDIKSPKVVDWKIYKEGKKSYYQIIRVDRKNKMYMGRIVGIKSLPDAVGITAVRVLINTAQWELMLLVYFNEKYAK
uniref:Uncharacterized protein n=1 Tax=Tanacetum cinerariifolium TaxID=118510 RepID=A0A6L2MQZ4_TANCI|nr:hypothetical protein [Tanacetum cinerariifolium]